MKPTSSWILVGFVTTEPQWELFFFSFPFLAAPWHVELPGQGSDPSRSCDLCCTCGNTGSLSHCAEPGIKPMLRCSQDIAHPIVPQQELQGTPFLIHNCCQMSSLPPPLARVVSSGVWFFRAHRLSSVAPFPHRLMESRSFYTAYLQRLSGVIRKPVPTTTVPTTTRTVAPTVWKVADP